MSHLALKSGYTEMVERLNRFPQGAPPSETLYKILRLLLTEREAALAARREKDRLRKRAERERERLAGEEQG